MFLCVSPNPAIDKRLLLSTLSPGQVHRLRSASAHPGGKAAHVAMVLRTLGAEPLWIGFAGGKTGDDLISGLKHLRIRVHACPTQQETRVNIEMIEDNGRVTEFLEPGATPSQNEIAEFLRNCESAFAQGRERLMAIFSGSLPPGVGDDFYASLIGRAHSFGCRTFLDTSGAPLRLGLAARPHYIKPNRQEAEWLLGETISDIPAGVRAVHQLISLGAQSAALSLGEQGLLLCLRKDGAVYHAPAIAVRARSTVGCGDAAVAALAHAAALRIPAEEALRLAAACAAANCLADSPGAARLADIEKLRAQAVVEVFSGEG